MGINRMQGTSAHLEYIGPKGRKRRDSCIYYKDGKCDNMTIITFALKCVGRMYCSNFDDSEEGKKKYLKFKNLQKEYEVKLKSEKRKKKIESHPLYNKKMILEDIATGKQYNCMIVHPSKENLQSFMISSISEIGNAFKMGKVNSIVKFKYFKQYFEFKIIKIYD